MSRYKEPISEIVDDGRWLELDGDHPVQADDGFVPCNYSPVSLGDALASVSALWTKHREIGSSCESPIEEALGAEILLAAERAGIVLRLCTTVDLSNQDDGLILVPQFRWSVYRSDWAIMKNLPDASALLIECDGKEFHSSPEQIVHDLKKDAAALDRGFLTLRFSGSEIYRQPRQCAARVLEAIRT